MIRGTSLSLTLAAMTLVAPALYGQVPYRVKDINPTLQPSSASNVSNIARVGDAVYFSAADGQNGTELWTSDGTAAGTHLVKDIFQGVSSSSPARLTSAGGLLFFTISGLTQLWRSDGTEAGTFLLRSFSSLGLGTSFQGMFFFGADGQLWKSDGTPSGTVPVKDTPGSTLENPGAFTVVGDRLFFTAAASLGRTCLPFIGSAVGPEVSLEHD